MLPAVRLTPAHGATMTDGKMRLLAIAVLFTGVPLVAACGGPACAHGDESEDEAVYTLWGAA